jgi:photosystem II Psb28-2 protein
MTNINPSIEFFVGLSEELSNVSLKHNPRTNVFTVVFFFEKLKALEKFQSFTSQTYGDLRLMDEEGTITVHPLGTRVMFGGDDADDLMGVECTFEVHDDGHWDRFLRFMERYAEANGMEFSKK